MVNDPVSVLNSIPIEKQKRNKFDRSHSVKMTGQHGTLMPFLAEEVLPGDIYNIGLDALMRYQPLVSPIMHSVHMYAYFFFVPKRIVYEDPKEWENFITGNEEVSWPYITIDGTETDEQKRMLDYLGIPPWDHAGTGTSNTSEDIDASIPACYQMIYSEYFRDQNIITEPEYKVIAGSNAARKNTLLTLRKRAWRRDYFTAGLPQPQKGTAVEIPLGEVQLADDLTAKYPAFVNDAGNTINTGTVGTTLKQITPSGQDPQILVTNSVGSDNYPSIYDPAGTLVVGSTSITELRRAIKLQEWLEKNARGGTRYTEHILSHWGISSSDARLQRPEYITGMKAPVVISEVLNTSGEGALPQGNLAGHGVSVGKGYIGNFKAEEHGYIIGIINVLPQAVYSQGIPKHFQRKTRLDYFYPSFAHLGEQPVLKKELFAYDDQGNETFAYMPIYTDYRVPKDRIAGEFRETLDFWTMTREFASIPSLSQTFIQMNGEDVENVFVLTDSQDPILFDIYVRLMANRMIPVFGVPQI